MALPSNLIEEFAAVFDDTTKKKADTTCYGVMDGDDHVRLDGADQLTPVTLTVGAKDGDRVLVMIKNHKALVVGNVTHPVLFVGTLEASDAIIVNGYLTTNAERTTYDDTHHNGITFSNSGIGGSGGSGVSANWTLSASGVLTAVDAIISGQITASSGWLGAENQGFHIDSTGIYSGASDRSSINAGDIALSNAQFSRVIDGTNRLNLRMAIGSKFAVAADGTIYATGVELSGKIGASSGSIAGFTIDGTAIYSGQHSAYNSNVQGVFISPDHISLGPNAKFDVTKAGILTATDVDLTGVIKANTGYIGGTNGWTIKAGAIYSGLDSINGNAAGTYIGTDGIAQVGQTSNNVTPSVRIQNGVITAVGANISGTINAGLGNIGGWTITSSMLYKIVTAGGNDYQVFMQAGSGTNDTIFAARSKSSSIDTWTDNFKVRCDGYVFASNVEITGIIRANTGYIGGATNGWVIKAGAIHTSGHTAYNTANNGIYLGTDYIACGSGGMFYVGQDGVPHCNGAAIILNDPTIDSSGYGGSRLTFQVANHTYTEIGLTKHGTTIDSYINTTNSFAIYCNSGGFAVETLSNITLESTFNDIYLNVQDSVHIQGSLAVSQTAAFTGAITADAFNGLFGYRVYEEDNVSITSGNNATVNFTINTPTGYIFIGYRALSLSNGSTNGANYGQCSIHTFSTGDNGTKLSIKIHNFASTAAVIKVTAVVLFAKSTMTSV